MHLEYTDLSALREGRLSEEEQRSLEGHLLECARCRSRLLEWHGERSGPAETVKRIPQGEYSAIVDSVFDTVRAENQRLENERAAASEAASILLSLSEERQDLLIGNSSRYQSWGLAERLLADCRARWSDDPLTAEAMARLALRVADSIPSDVPRERFVSDLKAEAWSYIANCCRIRFELDRAGEAFEQAERHLVAGTGDLTDRARLLDLKASYFCAARRFDAAARCLEGAIAGYRAASDPHLEGRAFLTYAKVLYDGGDVQRAVGALHRADELIDCRREPHLELLLKEAELIYLTELDQLDDACRLLPELRELVRVRASRSERLRFLWNEGLLRAKLGQTELAEEALKQVREGFLAEDRISELALVSLDLASLYLELGKTDEVRRLALEAAPIYASRGVEREVLLAWRLFRKAAERDSVTLELVGQLSDRIKKQAQLG